MIGSERPNWAGLELWTLWTGQKSGSAQSGLVAWAPEPDTFKSVSSQISTSSTPSIENDDGSIQADMKKIIKKSKKNGSRLQNDDDAKTKINDLLDEWVFWCTGAWIWWKFLSLWDFFLCILKSPVQMSGSEVRLIFRSMSGSVQLKNLRFKSLTTS